VACSDSGTFEIDLGVDRDVSEATNLGEYAFDRFPKCLQAMVKCSLSHLHGVLRF